MMGRTYNKTLLITLALIFQAIARATVEIVSVEDLPDAPVNREEIVLDLAEAVNRNQFDEEFVNFKDITTLSITPVESYQVVAVKEGKKDIYVCKEDTGDFVYEVILHRDEKYGYVVVFAQHGISFFRRSEGEYTEIQDYREIPDQLLALLPLQQEDGAFNPVCGNGTMTESSDYAKTVAVSGNLSGSEACVLV